MKRVIVAVAGGLLFVALLTAQLLQPVREFIERIELWAGNFRSVAAVLTTLVALALGLFLMARDKIRAKSSTQAKTGGAGEPNLPPA